MVLGFNKIEF